MTAPNTLSTAIALLLGTVGIPTLAAPGATNDAPPAATSATDTGQPQDAPSDRLPRTLGTIQVTAERRSENLQKTAVAVGVVDNALIQERGLNTIGDILAQTPSLMMAGINKGQSVYIRGVGSTGDSQEGGDPAVNFNIDGVYQAQPTSTLASSLDIDRVEVLRGPQGTLYGRNANAGSINVYTHDPALDGSLHGVATLDVSNFNGLRTEAASDLPVNEVFGLRVAAATSHHDGYLSDGNGGEDGRIARLKALYQPSDDLKIRFAVQHARETGAPNTIVALPLDSDPWHSSLQTNMQDVKNTMVYGQLDYTTSIGTLTLLPTYNKTDNWQDASDLSGFTNASQYIENARSFEARLVSLPGSPITWVGGLYYYDSKDERVQDPRAVLTGTSVGSTTYPSDALHYSLTTSYAGYGQATFPLTESGLKLVTGLRFTRDEKGFDYITSTSATTTEPGPRYRDSWDAWTYRVGLNQELGRDSLLYGDVRTGMKSGGMNNNGTSSYDPEKITAFEIGSKNRIANDTLQLNATAFYYDYSNYQARVPYLDSTSSSGWAFAIQNAASARIYGAELETNWMPDTSNRLDVNLSYLHARFGNFTYDSSSGTVDRSGETMPNAPTWSGLVSYSHYWDLASGANVTGRIDMHYSASYDSSLDTVDNGWDLQSNFTRTDVSLIYNAPSGAWSLRAYVRNIENKAQLTYSLEPNSSYIGALVTDPRTYGLSATVRF